MAWQAFTDGHADELNDPRFPEALHGAWGKLRGYGGRLALILHLLREAAGEPVGRAVDEDSLGRAARLVAYFKGHARRVNQAIGRDPRIRSASRVLSWLQNRGQQTVSQRDLWRSLRCSFDRVADPTTVLNLLVQLHYLRPVVQNVPKGGRPRGPLYEVNPLAPSP
jgi:hypothetical protein